MTTPTGSVDGKIDALFDDSFHEWLEKHGVLLGNCDEGEFMAVVNLNVLKSGILQLILARENAAKLEKEIEIHDWYWHHQIYIGAHGIGPVSLENKEKAQSQLQSLPNTTKEG